MKFMNEYLKKYIELQKKFNEPKGKSESVRALHAFKEELEQMEDLQAKEVLVNVYNLLDYKKSAYDLLCKIGDKSDPEVFKRLATMKDYAEKWGDHYALKEPKTKGGQGSGKTATNGFAVFQISSKSFRNRSF